MCKNMLKLFTKSGEITKPSSLYSFGYNIQMSHDGKTICVVDAEKCLIYFYDKHNDGIFYLTTQLSNYFYKNQNHLGSSITFDPSDNLCFVSTNNSNYIDFEPNITESDYTSDVIIFFRPKSIGTTLENGQVVANNILMWQHLTKIKPENSNYVVVDLCVRSNILYIIYYSTTYYYINSYNISQIYNYINTNNTENLFNFNVIKSEYTPNIESIYTSAKINNNQALTPIVTFFSKNSSICHYSLGSSYAAFSLLGNNEYITDIWLDSSSNLPTYFILSSLNKVKQINRKSDGTIETIPIFDISSVYHPNKILVQQSIMVLGSVLDQMISIYNKRSGTWTFETSFHGNESYGYRIHMNLEGTEIIVSEPKSSRIYRYFFDPEGQIWLNQELDTNGFGYNFQMDQSGNILGVANSSERTLDIYENISKDIIYHNSSSLNISNLNQVYFSTNGTIAIAKNSNGFLQRINIQNNKTFGVQNIGITTAGNVELDEDGNHMMVNGTNLYKYINSLSSLRGNSENLYKRYINVDITNKFPTFTSMKYSKNKLYFKTSTKQLIYDYMDDVLYQNKYDYNVYESQITYTQTIVDMSWTNEYDPYEFRVETGFTISITSISNIYDKLVNLTYNNISEDQTIFSKVNSFVNDDGSFQLALNTTLTEWYKEVSSTRWGGWNLYRTFTFTFPNYPIFDNIQNMNSNRQVVLDTRYPSQNFLRKGPDPIRFSESYKLYSNPKTIISLNVPLTANFVQWQGDKIYLLNENQLYRFQALDNYYAPIIYDLSSTPLFIKYNPDANILIAKTSTTLQFYYFKNDQIVPYIADITSLNYSINSIVDLTENYLMIANTNLLKIYRISKIERWISNRFQIELLFTLSQTLTFSSNILKFKINIRNDLLVYITNNIYIYPNYSITNKSFQHMYRFIETKGDNDLLNTNCEFYYNLNRILGSRYVSNYLNSYTPSETFVKDEFNCYFYQKISVQNIENTYLIDYNQTIIYPESTANDYIPITRCRTLQILEDYIQNQNLKSNTFQLSYTNYMKVESYIESTNSKYKAQVLNDVENLSDEFNILSLQDNPNIYKTDGEYYFCKSDKNGSDLNYDPFLKTSVKDSDFFKLAYNGMVHSIRIVNLENPKPSKSTSFYFVRKIKVKVLKTLKSVYNYLSTSNLDFGKNLDISPEGKDIAVQSNLDGLASIDYSKKTIKITKLLTKTYTASNFLSTDATIKTINPYNEIQSQNASFIDNQSGLDLILPGTSSSTMGNIITQLNTAISNNTCSATFQVFYGAKMIWYGAAGWMTKARLLLNGINLIESDYVGIRQSGIELYSTGESDTDLTPNPRCGYQKDITSSIPTSASLEYKPIYYFYDNGEKPNLNTLVNYGADIEWYFSFVITITPTDDYFKRFLQKVIQYSPISYFRMENQIWKQKQAIVFNRNTNDIPKINNFGISLNRIKSTSKVDLIYINQLLKEKPPTKLFLFQEGISVFYSPNSYQILDKNIAVNSDLFKTINLNISGATIFNSFYYGNNIIGLNIVDPNKYFKLGLLFISISSNLSFSSSIYYQQVISYSPTKIIRMDNGFFTLASSTISYTSFNPTLLSYTEYFNNPNNMNPGRLGYTSNSFNYSNQYTLLFNVLDLCIFGNLYVAVGDNASIATISRPFGSSPWSRIIVPDPYDRDPNNTSNIPIICRTVLNVWDKVFIAGTNRIYRMENINTIVRENSDISGIYDIQSMATDQNKIIAVGKNGVILLRRSNSNQWSKINTSLIFNLNCIIYDGNKFIATGDKNTIIISNNGYVWNRLESTLYVDKSVHFTQIIYQPNSNDNFKYILIYKFETENDYRILITQSIEADTRGITFLTKDSQNSTKLLAVNQKIATILDSSNLINNKYRFDVSAQIMISEEIGDLILNDKDIYNLNQDLGIIKKYTDISGISVSNKKGDVILSKNNILSFGRNFAKHGDYYIVGTEEGKVYIYHKLDSTIVSIIDSNLSSKFFGSNIISRDNKFYINDPKNNLIHIFEGIDYYNLSSSY